MWFGQGHREPNPVPVPGMAKSPEDPKQMHRGSAPDPERSRRKLPRQEGEGVWPGAHGTDPVPMPRKSQVPPEETAKCRRSAQGPGRPARGAQRGNPGKPDASVKVWGNLESVGA